MSDIWITSDAHFSHKNILIYDNRPFSSVEEMDEKLISNWNERVKPGDTMYYLGDFAFKSKNVYKLFTRLNGNKILIKGNHDKKDTLKLPWAGVYDIYELNYDNKLVIFCHYSMRVWKNSCHGSWMLFGHSHLKLPSYGLSFDVGCMGNSYYPYSWDEIKAKMATLSTKDHPESDIINQNDGSDSV